MSDRWCRFGAAGEIVRAAGPLPYFYNDANGDVVESRAVPVERLLADGWKPVVVLGRPFDPEVEQEIAPEFEVSGGVPIERRRFRPRPDAMERMIARIEREFEGLRLDENDQYVGKRRLYDLKLAEARAYQADPGGDYPLLVASLGIHGDTLAEVAALVIAKDAELNARIVATEVNRLQALASVRSAPTVEDAIQAFYTTYPPPEDPA